MKITHETYMKANKLYDEICDHLEENGVDTWDFEGVDRYTSEKYGFKLSDLAKVTEAFKGQEKYGNWGKWTEEKAAKVLSDIEAKFRGTNAE